MKNIFVGLLLLLSFSLVGQSFHKCGDVLLKHQLENKYPGIGELINQAFHNAQNSTTTRAAVLRIPVVFHVVYNNDSQNISDEILKSQLEVLNEDFRRMNANASETRDTFLLIAADAEIEFFLAGEDPDGNQSTGITRTYTDMPSFINISIAEFLEAFAECGTDFNDPAVVACFDEFFSESDDLDLDAMKSSETGGKDAWDTNRYLNIWVANLGLDAMGGEPIPFILGFAYPPMEAPNWPGDVFPEELEKKDGVVLHYSCVGKNNPNAGMLTGLNDEGRTCVHEVGHYLGLRHIWGDGDCTMDDGIDDTPTAASESQATEDVSSCTEFHNKDTCFDDMFPDMIENYMDYSIERCQNMFTSEQATLMRAMLEGPRSGLLNNQISGVLKSQEKFNVYPNPSNGLLHIDGDTQVIQTIKVYDSAGRLVLKTQDLTFELATEESGLYIIEIVGQSSSTIHKIIVQK